MAVDEDAEQEYVPRLEENRSMTMKGLSLSSFLSISICASDLKAYICVCVFVCFDVLISRKKKLVPGGLMKVVAMKVENMLKIKEEFDYKSLSRRLETQLDKLIAENERQQNAFEDEIERVTLEAQSHVSEAERNFVDALEVFLGLVDHEKESIKSRAGNTPI
ncbi:Kinesin-like protein KIN-UA [Camellia lanceoleosa]|uniref:Kinesin-like protein KIN-UA n=1 Tax=Camellia lanceoleosa TaxID=1840588 RepID=A0ACC0H983_9ERIC|nr:Kinesin-like protein KIN-UA [Camellia lanceoleosa]